MSHPANWYPDPHVPSQLRYWDGVQWTTHVASAPAPEPTPLPSGSAPAYRSTRAAAVTSAVAIGGIVVVELVEALLVRPAFRSFEEAARRGEGSDAVWTPYDTAVMVDLLLLAVAGVASCIWLWGARRNAEALNPTQRHARGRGWVWGGWICPVVSLWFPYQVVRDVIRATRGDRSLRVGWWWAAFAVYVLLSQGGGSLAADESAEAIHDLTAVATADEVAGVVVAAVCAVLWMRILRGVTRDQRRAAEARTAV